MCPACKALGAHAARAAWEKNVWCRLLRWSMICFITEELIITAGTVPSKGGEQRKAIAGGSSSAQRSWAVCSCLFIRLLSLLQAGALSLGPELPAISFQNARKRWRAFLCFHVIPGLGEGGGGKNSHALLLAGPD